MYLPLKCLTQYLQDSNHSVLSLPFKIHTGLAVAVFHKSDCDTYGVSSESWYNGVKQNTVLVKEVIINDLQNVDIKHHCLLSVLTLCPRPPTNRPRPTTHMPRQTK